MRIVGNEAFCMRKWQYVAHFVLGQVGIVKIVVKMYKKYNKLRHCVKIEEVFS